MLRCQFQCGLDHFADAPRREQPDAGLIEQERPPRVVGRADRRPSQDAALEFGHRATANELSAIRGRRRVRRGGQVFENELRCSHADHAAVRDGRRSDRHAVEAGAVAAAQIVQHPGVAQSIKTHGGMRATGESVGHNDRGLGRAAERVVVGGVEHERRPRAAGDPQHERSWNRVDVRNGNRCARHDGALGRRGRNRQGGGAEREGRGFSTNITINLIGP